MRTVLLFLTVIVVTLISSAAGARILALLPLAGKSHHIFFQAILKALANRGHKVVVYSPFPQDKPMDNYVDVYVNTSFTDSFVTYELIKEMLNTSPIAGMTGMWKTMDPIVEESFQHENVQKLAKSSEKFDLVITETFFGQEALLGFGSKFNAPTIAVQPFGTFSVCNSIMGNSLALPYIPDTGLSMTDHMTFYDRLINSYSILRSLVPFYFHHISDQQAILDRYLKLQGAPSLANMIQNISLVLTNAHPTIHYAQPFTPNIIKLGGIHVSKERKPLPQNIQKFMDEAKNGVIYFSFGTFVPIHLMPEEFIQSFVNVFKKLPQRILWKTKTENIRGLPNNVMTAKWMPQQDILAHPNCVLFMTHGGLLSLLEAIYAGVPVVGTPFFGDQPMNLAYYEQKGIGVKLDFLTLSEENIHSAVTTVLNNPQYKENAMRLSRIYKDLPMSQADSAVFWVEYVLRHGGAHHLRPASTQLRWYQLALLDVLAAILAFATIMLLILYFTCRKVVSYLCGAKKKDDLNKKKN